MIKGTFFLHVIQTEKSMSNHHPGVFSFFPDTEGKSVPSLPDFGKTYHVKGTTRGVACPVHFDLTTFSLQE